MSWRVAKVPLRVQTRRSLFDSCKVVMYVLRLALRMGSGSAELLLKSLRHLALHMAFVVARDRVVHRGSPPKSADSKVRVKYL